MSRRMTGTARVALGLFLLSMSAPLAEARPPDATLTAADGDVKQTITGLALDAQGRFAAAVVEADAAALVTGNKDVFVWDITGTGKVYAERHAAANRDTALSKAQSIAASASTSNPGQVFFAVGGPSSLVSRWRATSSSPDWEKKVVDPGTATVVAVAINEDGTRVFAGANFAKGVVYTYEGNTGKFLWSYNVSDSFASQTVKITTMALSRVNNVLVVGTTEGIVLLDAGSRLEPKEVFEKGNLGQILSIDVSRDGRFFAVGTQYDQTNGNFCLFINTADQRDRPWCRSLDSPVPAVAMSLDGRFVAAGTTAGRIVFIERTDNDLLAQTRGDPYQADSAIVALDYDASGATLVATSQNRVYGFHPSRSAHIWRIEPSALGVDTPLSGVRVGDTGERFVIAGKQRILPFRMTYAAEAGVVGGERQSAAPGDVVRYTILVRNTGSTPDTYAVDVETPPGWTRELVVHRPKGQENLGPNERVLLPEDSGTFNLTLQAPTGQAPGSLLTKVRIYSKALQALNDPKRPANFRTLELNVTTLRVSNVRIEANAREVKLNQGEEVNVPFTVRNLGNADAWVNFTAQQEPSQGNAWRLRFEKDSLRVGPGGSASGVFFVTAPEDAADGDYNDVTIRGSVGGTQASDFAVRARVNPLYDFQLRAKEEVSTIQVKAGESKALQVQVLNTGNTADSINLTARLGGGAASTWRATLDYSSVQIAKGGIRTITVTLKPSTGTAGDGTVTVTGRSQASGKESSPLTFNVELAPIPETSGGGVAQKLPVPPAVAALAALALVAAFWRRKR